MYQAIRGNVIINIFEQDIEKYLNLGYNITDMNGKLMYEAVPNDTTTLKRAFERHKKQIKLQQTQIEQLQAEVKELTAKLNDKQAIVEPAVETEKPKRVRKTIAVSE